MFSYCYLNKFISKFNISRSRDTLNLTAQQYGEVVFRQLADGALFAVMACPDRAVGERHGYKFC